MLFKRLQTEKDSFDGWLNQAMCGLAALLPSYLLAGGCKLALLCWWMSAFIHAFDLSSDLE